MSKVNEKVDSSLEREETLIQKILGRVNDKLKSEGGNSGLIQETLNRVSANLNSRLTQAKQYVENIFTRVSARLGFGDDDDNKDTEEKVHSQTDDVRKSEFQLSADDVILMYDLCRYEIQAQSSDGSVKIDFAFTVLRT